MEKTISSVDSLPDGRRIIHFNPKEPVIGCGDQYMIEGIGGSGGLLEGPACFHFWTSDNHLVCYVQNGMLVYHNNNFGFNCEIIEEQGTRPYLDATCIWRIDKQVVSDGTSDFEKFIYFIDGDTLINTVHCWKLYKSGYQLFIDETGRFTSGFNDSVYMGALRESDHSLYFTAKGSAAEELLYKFAVQPGKKITGTIYSGDTVRSVKTILDNRVFLYLSESTWEHYLVEGIGSDKGLLENKDENSTLICFMRNGASIYHTGNGSECNLEYMDMCFPYCDKLAISPSSPDEEEEIKVISRVCYQVSNSNPEKPVLADRILTNYDNSLVLEHYYTYDDQNDQDKVKTVYPVFDTLVLGELAPGDYSVELIVHTIHQGDGYTDTSFYDKSQYLSFSVGQSQTSSRFPINPLSRWKISEITYDFEINGEKVNEKYEYFIDSDTTINAQKYYKLYKSGVAYYDTPFHYQHVYAGAIRDESNKFYLVRKDQDEEVLLIDFNQNLEDTIQGEIGNGSIINFVETLPDGRKRISSIPEICGGCCSTITLLEGIGHSGGIMEDPPCYHIGFYGHYLNCFEIDGELIYQNDMSLVDCANFLSSEGKPVNMPDVRVYPVPATGSLSLELVNMQAKSHFLSIFDITGSVVLTQEIPSGKTDLDIRNMAQGIYLIRITDNGYSFTRTFIVE